MTALLSPIQGSPPVPDSESRPGASGRFTTGRTGEAQISDAAVRAALREADGSRIVSNGRTLEVSFNSDLNRLILKLKSDTGEIIRQVPPEDYVRFLTRLDEMVGVLFDHKA